MSATKKAALVLQHQDGGGQIALEGFGNPQTHSITVKNAGQAISIASLLLRGSANAVPLQHLQTLTGLDERTVRRMIWRERLGGACICMDCRSGYYLAATAAERDRCARSMEHRAAEIYRTAQAIASAEVAGDG